MGQDPDALSPLTSESLAEAQSGGTCVVRVTSSGFGTGAAWESERTSSNVRATPGLIHARYRTR